MDPKSIVQRLVQDGALQPEKLASGEEIADGAGLPLVRVLLHMKLVDPSAVAKAISVVGRRQVLNLDRWVSPSPLPSFTEGLCRELRVFPLAFEPGDDDRGERLVLGMADPSDADAGVKVAALIGRDVRSVLVDDAALTRAIQRRYAPAPAPKTELVLVEEMGDLQDLRANEFEDDAATVAGGTRAFSGVDKLASIGSREKPAPASSGDGAFAAIDESDDGDSVTDEVANQLAQQARAIANHHGKGAADDESGDIDLTSIARAAVAEAHAQLAEATRVEPRESLVDDSDEETKSRLRPKPKAPLASQTQRVAAPSLASRPSSSQQSQSQSRRAPSGSPLVSRRDRDSLIDVSVEVRDTTEGEPVLDRSDNDVFASVDAASVLAPSGTHNRFVRDTVLAASPFLQPGRTNTDLAEAGKLGKLRIVVVSHEADARLRIAADLAPFVKEAQVLDDLQKAEKASKAAPLDEVIVHEPKNDVATGVLLDRIARAARRPVVIISNDDSFDALPCVRKRLAAPELTSGLAAVILEALFER